MCKHYKAALSANYMASKAKSAIIYSHFFAKTKSWSIMQLVNHLRIHPTCRLMTFFFASLHILMCKQPSLHVTTNSSSRTHCVEQPGRVCLVKRDGKANDGLSITTRFLWGDKVIPFRLFLIFWPNNKHKVKLNFVKSMIWKLYTHSDLTQTKFALTNQFFAKNLNEMWAKDVLKVQVIAQQNRSLKKTVILLFLIKNHDAWLTWKDKQF